MSGQQEHTVRAALSEAISEGIGVLGAIITEAIAVILALIAWYCVEEIKVWVGPKVATKAIFDFLAVFAQISIGTIFVLQFIRTVIVHLGRVAEACRSTFAIIWRKQSSGPINPPGWHR